MLFRDRIDAGHRLAERLQALRGSDCVVLGVPRGGVPVAAVVAETLDAPLDVVVVRKLGVPWQPELAMGAVGERGVRVVNDDIVDAAGVTQQALVETELRERAEVLARGRRFRGDRSPLPLSGRTAVLVDDGVATGATAAAACQVVRALGASRVVVAVPVASRDALGRLREQADDVVCLAAPEPFYGVGRWYSGFGAVPDTEVVRLLEEARSRLGAAPTAQEDGDVDAEVSLDGGGVLLPAHVTVPPHASGLVLFAHGSGSSRRSPRNQHVARTLNDAGLGTVLVDLLTAQEEGSRANVFDIDLLADRLAALTRTLALDPRTAGLPIGYFGASTGAAAALAAAAEPGNPVRAIVSRGGRPDLAGDRLPLVEVPTLLVVGGRDAAVLGLNHRALRRLRCRNRLAVVPGASHLFEEPGTLDAVARLATEWFRVHLATHAPADRRSRTSADGTFDPGPPAGGGVE
jgi:putative phosphoribosyl transferase